jgi:hypothetical protein
LITAPLQHASQFRHRSACNEAGKPLFSSRIFRQIERATSLGILTAIVLILSAIDLPGLTVRVESEHISDYLPDRRLNGIHPFLFIIFQIRYIIP